VKRAPALPKAPAELGFAMPAEWAPHAATWIAWPHNATDWPGKFPPIQWVYGELVRHLAGRERVRILVPDAAREAAARRVLRKVGADLSHVDWYRIPTNRSWTRDTGAIFVRHPDGRVAATTWRFNAWAKYPDYARDATVATKMAAACRVPTWTPTVPGGKKPAPVVLEGGAIDVDGEGTLLATEECLLSDVQERNPGLGREALEAALGAALGTRKVVWIPHGIVGDDTHGHIDDVCRFVAPGRVLLCQENDARDENHRLLAECAERLQGARDAAGRRLDVIPLPMPAPLSFEGRRIPASYANFYIANGVVLCPTFNDPKDRVALGLLAELFPGRQVIGLHAVDLVWGLGTLHCMTQQQPA
jgi:agmatine deiminase